MFSTNTGVFSLLFPSTFSLRPRVFRSPPSDAKPHAGSYLFRLDERIRYTSYGEDNEVHGAASLEISRTDLVSLKRSDDPVRVIHRIPFISLPCSPRQL